MPYAIEKTTYILEKTRHIFRKTTDIFPKTRDIFGETRDISGETRDFFGVRYGIFSSILGRKRVSRSRTKKGLHQNHFDTVPRRIEAHAFRHKLEIRVCFIWLLQELQEQPPRGLEQKWQVLQEQQQEF